MILLGKTKYDKVIKPLNKVTINNLFARSVAENQVRGTIYVDDVDNPKTFFIIHPYGMSLLFGNMENDEFNTWLLDFSLNRNQVRDKIYWLQVFPASWKKK